MKTAARNGKHGSSFGIFIFIFQVDLNESRKGFCRRGRDRSFPPSERRVLRPQVLTTIDMCFPLTIATTDADNKQSGTKPDKSGGKTAEFVLLLLPAFTKRREFQILPTSASLSVRKTEESVQTQRGKPFPWRE